MFTRQRHYVMLTIYKIIGTILKILVSDEMDTTLDGQFAIIKESGSMLAIYYPNLHRTATHMSLAAASLEKGPSAASLEK